MAALPSPPATLAGLDTLPYEYLPITHHQIRLLRLYPAALSTDPLRGDLMVVGLDELPPPRPLNSSLPNHAPDPARHVVFDAISYVWGDAALTDAFITPAGPIPITTSLASVLRRLRATPDAVASAPASSPPAGALFWADAICIDQAAVGEKEHQVSLMGTVYGCAARVFCDLGEDSPDAHMVLDAMVSYGRRSVRHGLLMGQGDWPHIPGPHTAAIMGVELLTPEEADAIPEIEQGSLADQFVKFMSSPWFRRLWVVQEFVLAREAVMLLGLRRVAWGTLWAGMMSYKTVSWPWYTAGIGASDVFDLLLPYHSMCLIRAGRIADPETPHGEVFIDTMKMLSNATNINSAVGLPICLIGFCSSGVTIPRDRYFAILGLVGADQFGDLRADYTSPIEEITMRFWRKAYECPSGSDLLNATGLSCRSPHYPTWVLDVTTTSPWDHSWSLGPLTEASHNAGGSNTWTAHFFDDDPGRMFIRGYHLDDVSEVLPFPTDEEYDLESLLTRLLCSYTFFTSGLQTADNSSRLLYHPTGEHVHVAAWRTMANYNKSDNMAPLDEKFEAAFKMSVGLSLVGRSDSIEGRTVVEKIRASNLINEIHAFTAMAERLYATWGMRFCKTRKGYFACLHQGVRVGDPIWIISGCRLPSVLRPSPSHQGSLEFLGGGYVHGFMDEEALKMPGFKWRGISLR